MVDYKEFVEFHKKHPDLDNQEYYAEFPDTNKSTIRSWKLKTRKPIIEPEIQIPLPTEKEAEGAKGYEELLIDSLCEITKTDKALIQGLSVKAQVQFLKNKKEMLDNQEPEEKSSRASNAPILPIPKPIGANAKRFGIDEYIEFDGVKNEIRMEIPMTVLFDPEKNDALGRIEK